MWLSPPHLHHRAHCPLSIAHYPLPLPTAYCPRVHCSIRIALHPFLLPITCCLCPLPVTVVKNFTVPENYIIGSTCQLVSPTPSVLKEFELQHCLSDFQEVVEASVALCANRHRLIKREQSWPQLQPNNCLYSQPTPQPSCSLDRTQSSDSYTVPTKSLTHCTLRRAGQAVLAKTKCFVDSWYNQSLKDGFQRV